MPFTALQLFMGHSLDDKACRYRTSHAVYGIATSSRISLSIIATAGYRTSHAVYGIATFLAIYQIYTTFSVTGLVMPFTALQQ